MGVFNEADILIPKNIDFAKWSVVACDQFTSEPEYWHETENLVGDSISTLPLILPEIYLESGDKAERIANINSTMQKYLDTDVFEEFKNSMVYVKRTIGNGKIRRGIMGTVDLEEYDFSKGSQSKIRATEGTVLERIPPRVQIRENAALELPHIMLLIDDEELSVIEPLEDKISDMKKLYDFDLMQKGGHIEGYLLADSMVDGIKCGLSKLAERDVFDKKYGAKDKGILQFAVGDGNHSLATAKTCWENLKKTLSSEEQENHPARFALVELVNLHDTALEFEPIHRVVFDVDAEKLLEGLKNEYTLTDSADNSDGVHRIEYMYGDTEGEIFVKNTDNNLAVGALQKFLDKYLAENGGKVDYIHGADVVKKLSADSNSIGFCLPCMEKNQLFKTVILDGALPRKAFSMGEANEKRYYLECKKNK